MIISAIWIIYVINLISHNRFMIRSSAIVASKITTIGCSFFFKYLMAMPNMPEDIIYKINFITYKSLRNRRCIYYRYDHGANK